MSLFEENAEAVKMPNLQGPLLHCPHERTQQLSLLHGLQTICQAKTGKLFAQNDSFLSAESTETSSLHSFLL